MSEDMKQFLMVGLIWWLLTLLIIGIMPGCSGAPQFVTRQECEIYYRVRGSGEWKPAPATCTSYPEVTW